MDRRLRNRIVILLVLAGIVAYALVRLTGRQPVAKISAVTPVRENVVSSISSNGKVEPIAPFVMRAQLDTFVEKISAVEGQQVRKGQLLLELDVKDAAARLAEARSKLLRAEDDLRVAKAGGRSDEAAKAEGALATAVALRDRLQRNHDALERLIAQQAATKAEMAELHKVRVRAFIDEPELGGLETGEQVRITWDALPNRTWTGNTQVIPKQVVQRQARSVGELLCEVNN